MKCSLKWGKHYFPVLEKKKQREQMRIMRERERQQRDEQLRIKQEMRAHQLLEVRIIFCMSYYFISFHFSPPPFLAFNVVSTQQAISSQVFIICRYFLIIFLFLFYCYFLTDLIYFVYGFQLDCFKEKVELLCSLDCHYCC